MWRIRHSFTAASGRTLSFHQLHWLWALNRRHSNFSYTVNKVKKISISDICGSASRNYHSKHETINETTTGMPSRVPTAEHDAKKWLFCPKLRTCWLHRHTQQQHFSIWNLRFINWRTKETSAYKLTLIIKLVSISFGSTQRFNFRSEWNDGTWQEPDSHWRIYARCRILIKWLIVSLTSSCDSFIS